MRNILVSFLEQTVLVWPVIVKPEKVVPNGLLMVDAEKAAAWNNHAEHDVYGNPDVVIRGRSLALLVDGINALSHVCRVPVHARQLFNTLSVNVAKF